MCQIYVKPAGKTISTRLLRLAFDNNPDGFGILTVNADNTIEVKREEASWSRVKELVDASKDQTAVIHLRYRTAGVRGTENLHPFPLKHGWWLFHNGTLRMVGRHTVKNDTQLFIEKYFNPLMHDDPYRIVNQLPSIGKFIGKNNRFVVVSDKGEIFYANLGTFYKNSLDVLQANMYSHYTPRVNKSYFDWTEIHTAEEFASLPGKMMFSEFNKVMCKVQTRRRSFNIHWTRLSNTDYTPSIQYPIYEDWLMNFSKGGKKKSKKQLDLSMMEAF